MDIVKAVATMRFKYHSNMLDVVNVMNQLHLLSDNRAENANKHHVMECFDALEHLGIDVWQKRDR
jgi:hypothetical protein